MVASLAKAGIKVKPNPIEVGQYYSIVFDPDKAGDIMWARLGPGLAQRVHRHPGAVHPDRWLRPLAGRRQGLQRQGRRRPRRTPTAAAQSEAWKALNKEAMQNVWAIPTLFGRSQSMAGSKVHSASGDNGDLYFWAPFTLVAVRGHVRHAVGRRRPSPELVRSTPGGGTSRPPGSREHHRSELSSQPLVRRGSCWR